MSDRGNERKGSVGEVEDNRIKGRERENGEKERRNEGRRYF